MVKSKLRLMLITIMVLVAVFTGVAFAAAEDSSVGEVAVNAYDLSNAIIQPSEIVPGIIDEFYVRVDIKNAINIQAVQFKLEFDPNVLEVAEKEDPDTGEMVNDITAGVIKDQVADGGTIRDGKYITFSAGKSVAYTSSNSTSYYSLLKIKFRLKNSNAGFVKLDKSLLAFSLPGGTGYVDLTNTVIKDNLSFGTALLSSDANLQSLTLSSGTLMPEFDANETSYTANVANDVESITVTPVVNDSKAKVYVYDNEVVSGSASESISLAVGVGIPVTVNVVAEDNTTKQYTVTVTRQAAPLSSDANLQSLTLSSGTLMPGFDANEISYTANVANDVESITVTPVVNDSKAKVYVDGNEVVSGSASEPISLAVGLNPPITVKVVAEDSATKEYKVTVTRASGGSQDLSIQLSVVDGVYTSWNRPVSIFGTADRAVNWQVCVVDSSKENVISNNYSANSSTTMNWSWQPPDPMFGSGQYFFKVTADDGQGNVKTDYAEFRVYNYPLVFNKVNTTNFFGNAKTEFKRGDGCAVSAELTNLDSSPINDILTIIQIKDSEGKVVFLGFSNTEVTSLNDIAKAGVGFRIPEELSTGTYQVEVLAWNMWVSQQGHCAFATPVYSTFVITE